MLIHLADALDYLHRQRLIHRDIKPSNIIFVKGVSKFADIGLVTDVATDGRDATYVGTPGRIAPEGPGSPTSDIYSLGKVLYEAGLGLDIERFPELPTTLVDGEQEHQLQQIKSALFPNNNLQERIDNFMPYYAKYGPAFIDMFYEQSLSLKMEFIVVEISE